MNNTVQLIYNFFKNKGLSDNAIYGILGNAQAESSFDSNATNSSSGAYGIFQWLGSRKSDLIRFASTKGKDKADLWTQLEFAWHELTGAEKKTLSAINENPNASASEMAEIWERKYERSGGALMEERKQYATEWETYFSSQSVSGNSAPSVSENSVSGNTPTTSGNSTPTTSGNSAPTTSGNSTDIDLSFTGTIIKALTILLLCVALVAFLVLALKDSAIGGVTDIAKDVLSDVLSDKGKGGSKE